MSRYELELALEALYSGHYSTGLAHIEAVLAALPEEKTRLRSDALRARADALKVLERVSEDYLECFSFSLLCSLQSRSPGFPL